MGDAGEDTSPASLTSSLEPVVMPPAPSVTMKPPIATSEPAMVKAMVACGIVALGWENASPERIGVESISINFRCVESMAYTSKVSPKKDEVLMDVEGVDVGPSVTIPEGCAGGYTRLPASLKSSMPPA